MHRSQLGILLAAASLASCYAQVEDGSVQLTHALCPPSGPTNCIPGGGTSIPTFVPSGSNSFTVNVGDVPFLKSSSSAGPATLHTTLVLNKATFDINPSSGPNANFNGITQVQLLAHRPSSSPASPTDVPCPGSASNCAVIAVYNQSTDGVANQQIVLKSQVANLIDLIDQTSHSIVFEVSVKGVSPQPPFWSASFTMDLGLSARASLP